MRRMQVVCMYGVLSVLYLFQSMAWGQQPPATPPKAPAPPAKKAAPPAKPAATPAAPEAHGAAKRTTVLRASLDTLRVTLIVQRARLCDAVRALASSQAKVNIVLDDSLPASIREREVSHSLRDVTLRSALTALAKPDLAFEVLHEAICISTREGIADLVASAPVIPEDLSPPGKALLLKMQNQLISFSFENTPLRDAVSVLSQLTGVKMVVDAAIPPNKLRLVNVSMSDVHLESALFYVTGKDLNAVVSLGTFLISTNEGVQKELARRKTVIKKTEEKDKFGPLLDTRVTCEFSKTPLNDAVATLAKASKARIVFDPAALETEGRKATVTAKLVGIPLDDALEKILPPKLDYKVSEEGVIAIELKGPVKPATPPAPPSKQK